MVKEGKSCAEVGREYNLSRSMVSRWVGQAQINDRPIFTGNGNASLTEAEKKYKKLEKAYLEIKMERDILKEAAAFFPNSKGKNLNS